MGAAHYDYAPYGDLYGNYYGSADVPYTYGDAYGSTAVPYAYDPYDSGMPPMPMMPTAPRKFRPRVLLPLTR